MIRMPQSSDTRSALSWVILRIALAGLLAAHGWVRLMHGGVVPFGEWLSSQVVPFGLLIAAAITGIGIVGTVLFAIGVGVFELSIVFSIIYATGAVLVPPIGTAAWPINLSGWLVCRWCRSQRHGIQRLAHRLLAAGGMATPRSFKTEA